MNIETLIHIKDMLEDDARRKRIILRELHRLYYEEQQDIEASGSNRVNPKKQEYEEASSEFVKAKTVLDDFLSVEWRA